MKKILFPVAGSVLIVVLSTVVIFQAGKYKKVVENGAVRDSSVAESALEDTLTEQSEPASYAEFIATLPECGQIGSVEEENEQYVRFMPEMFEVFNSGYKLQTICHDDFDESIGMIFARPVLTQVSGATGIATCQDLCDEVIFATYDDSQGTNPRQRVQISDHNFGFYAEAYSSYAEIDAVQTKGAGESSMRFYVGNGEAGGLTGWYQYTFGFDELILAQGIDEVVKDADIMDQFKYKTSQAFFQVQR